MATCRSKIPKFPLSSNSTKEPNENMPPVTEKKTELGIPTLKTPSRFQKSHSIPSTGCFSENAKRKAFQQKRTLSTVKENGPIPKIQVSSGVPPRAKRSKRPGWDISGKIQDMEAINGGLKGKLEALADQIAALETTKDQLNQDAQVKSVQSQEASVTIVKLKKALCEKMEELSKTLKEKDAKITTLQSLCDPLEKENLLLKDELLSLKLCDVTSRNSIPTLTMQAGEAKLSLTQIQEQCEKKDKTLQKLQTDNLRLSAEAKEQEAVNKEMQLLIQKKTLTLKV